jgi:hypothetical protein
LIAWRSCRFKASIALVVYTTRRTFSGKARGLGGVRLNGGEDRLQGAGDSLPLRLGT